jgi:hypothetical protein
MDLDRHMTHEPISRSASNITLAVIPIAGAKTLTLHKEIVPIFMKLGMYVV